MIAPAKGPHSKAQHAAKRKRTAKLLRVPLDKIDPNPTNARENAEQDLASLVATVKAVGVVQPPTVRRKADGRFELVAGERRWRAAKRAGRRFLEVIVRNLSDEDASVHSLLENLHRRDLNPIEKARGIEQLCRPVAAGGLGKPISDVARILGRTRSWAAHTLRLLKLPEAWQQRVAGGELSGSHARLLVAYAENSAMLAAVEQDMAENPWAWRLRADFERNLKILASNPSLAAAAIEPATKPRTPPFTASTRAWAHAGEPMASNSRESKASQAAAAIDEGDAPLDGSASFDRPNPTALVDDICDRVCQINTIDELVAVKEAVDLRLALLRGKIETPKNKAFISNI